jgi:hemoglobin/transferrin/lactoferrin receptor protein
VYGGFLQAHFNFFRFVDLIAAARYDSYSIEGGTVSLDDQRLSPKITLGVTPLAGITVFSTYAEGFRAPAVTETLVSGTHAAFVPFRFLPNPALRPEVAHNVEAGVNLRFDGIVTTRDAFRAKLVVFKNSIEDYIDGRGIDGPGSFCFSTGFPCLASSTFQYVNFASVTIKGVEAELAYDARAWFMQLSASRIRGTDDDTGSPLLSIPADRVTLTLGTRLMQERLALGVRTALVDAQTRVPLGATPSQAYTLVDIFAQYAWSDSVVFNLNVDNIFDEQYIEYRNQSASPGLNARIGATMRFGGP